MHKTQLWKWIAPAACLGLLAFTGLFLFGCNENPDDDQPVTVGASAVQPETLATQPEPVGIYDRQWEPVYNDLGVQTSPTGDVYRPTGYYYESLTEEQLEMVLPEKQGNWKVDSAEAGFLVTGEIDSVSLKLTTETGSVSVLLGNPLPGGDVYYRDTELKASQCGDVTYKIIYRVWDLNDLSWVALGANTTINGVPFYFGMAAMEPEKDLAVFESVLECFSWYETKKPALDPIKPSRIPEFINEKLSHSEALADPDFGPWLLEELPANLKRLDCWRYKDYDDDQLTANWRSDSTVLTNTVSVSIQWRVSRVSEFDKGQIVSPTETEKYDISLYPPPRAETIPNELALVVRNPIFRIEDLSMDVIMLRYDTATYDIIGNKNMEFGVLYGDILVEVDTRNIEPQWLYEQLMKLPKS